MGRVPDAGCDDLGIETILVDDLDGLGEHVDTVGADVVQPPYEGGDEPCSGLGCHEGLQRVEDKGHVDCDTLGGEGLGSLQGLDAHGEFDIDIGCDSGQFLSLGYHSVRIESHDLCGYGAVSEDLGDLLDAGGGVGVLLGYETGVGGDSVEDPPAVDLLDHVEICSVYEYLHLIISSC